MMWSFSGILVHHVGNHSSRDKRKLISERVFDFAGEMVSQNRSRKRSTTRMTLPISSFFIASTLRGGNAGTNSTAPTSPDAVCSTAKRRDLPYQSGDRTGMQKIKRQRTADCVVGGFRYLEKQPLVGSLLLGLYNDEGQLDHVGFTSSIPAKDRPALTRKLKKIIKPPGFTGKAPGGPSPWSTKRSSEWKPLDPKLVAEVQFDHFTAGRFRHGTKLLRWCPEKSPEDCTLRQVQRENA